MTEEKTIPYIAHESEVARLERVIKRLWILCIIIFLAFVISNGAWIWYENQFTDEVTTETYTAENDGNGNAIANGEGSVVINGESELYEDN